MGLGKIKKLTLTHLKIFINVLNKIYSFSSGQACGEELYDSGTVHPGITKKKLIMYLHY